MKDFSRHIRNKVLIELHVPDFQKVKEYYLKLGFDIVWERKPEDFKGYLVLRMSDNILCFWAGNEKVYQHPIFKEYRKEIPRGIGVEVILMVENIEAFYEKVKDSANVVEPLIKQPWGLKDFQARDPFGYYLRFTEPHDILDSKYAVK